MFVLRYRNRKFNVAESWNDLNGKQLVETMKVLYDDIPPLQAQLHLWKVVTGMRWYQYFAVPNHVLLNSLGLTDFIFDKNDLTKQLLPRYKNFYGPDEDFYNLVMNEFIFSEMYHEKYMKEKEEDDLNRLVAVLYRPAKKNYDIDENKEGDIRDRFNENTIETRAKIIAKWPIEVKHAILAWYAACKQSLSDENRSVFGKGKGNGQSGLLNIMRAVAKDGTYGNFEKVEQMYVRTFLMELREKVKEVEAIKRSF